MRVCVYCTYRVVVLQASIFSFLLLLGVLGLALSSREHNGFRYHGRTLDGRENGTYKRRMNRLWIDMTLDGKLGNQELEDKEGSIEIDTSIA